MSVRLEFLEIETLTGNERITVKSISFELTRFTFHSGPVSEK